jgi:hypothetical protein
MTDTSRINTSTQMILASSGRSYPYRLERKRRWNIGLRRHENTLTGNIEVYLGDGVYTVCRDWPDALRAVDDVDPYIKVKPQPIKEPAP